MWCSGLTCQVVGILMRGYFNVSATGRLFLFLIVTLTSVPMVHHAAAQPFAVPPGVIVFVHEDSGSTDITQQRFNLRFMAAQNPTQQVPLTNFPVSLRMRDPIWSRDFSQILFSGDFNNGALSLESMSIYAVNADGSNLRVLTGFGVLGPLPGPFGTIRGQVVSGVAGGQLGSCFVSAQGTPHTASCAGGAFELPNVPATAIWVRAQATVNDAFGGPGLTMGFRTMTVTPGQVTEVGAIEVTPQFAKSIQPTLAPEGTRLITTLQVQSSSLQPDSITGTPRWMPFIGNSLTLWDAMGQQPVVISSPSIPHSVLLDVSGADWSPVQDRIAAAVSGASAGETFVMLMEPSGGNAQVLYQPPFNVFDPVLRFVTQCRWRPDGQQIAFILTSYALDLSGGWSDLFVINADGSNPRPLTRAAPSQFVTSPTWSPDGQALAFDVQIVPDLIAQVVQQSHIFVVDVAGSNGVQLTTDGRSWNPSWGTGVLRPGQVQAASDEVATPLPDIWLAPRTLAPTVDLERIRQWIDRFTEP